MIRKHFLTPALMLMLLLGITACAPAATEEAPSPQVAEAALTITGKIANETGWTLDELWCSGRKRTSALENVLGHTISDTITVLNSYQERQTVISPYPKNLE